jgi:hypothetical protein
MGTSLTGLTPATTYDALIKVGDNGPIDGTLKRLSDGLGNDLPMEASTSAVNFTGTLTQSGTALQPVLVSGTNIKTINGTSVLGSGNITTPNVSGVAGAIQFSNGSAFASDAANLFWDDTNNRLGIGTATPLGILHLKRTADTTRMVMDGDAGQSKIITYRTAGLQRFGLYVNNTAESGSNAGSDFAIRAYSDAGTLLNTPVFIKRSTGNVGIGTTAPTALLQIVGNWQSPSLVRQWFKLTEASTGNTFGIVPSQVGLSNAGYTFQVDEVNEIVGRIGQTLFGTNLTGGEMTARVGIRGNGSTSATTSLLVQNSAGSNALQVQDNLNTTLFGTLQFGNGNTYINNQSSSMVFAAVNSATADLHMIPGRQMNINNAGTYTAQASALLQVDSTTKGFLPPRMTTTQKNAIASPATGLQVFDSTMNATCEYNGTAWRVLSAGAQSVAASTATTTVNMSSGNVQNITLTASTTLTLSSATVGTYIMKLIQGGSGSYTVTWPGTVIWSGGTAPTLTTTVGKVDIVTLVFDGTNFYGTYSLNY